MQNNYEGNDTFNLKNNHITDSPSNKILNMKILTFGQNCNFPGENLNEFDDDYDDNNYIEDNKKEKSIFLIKFTFKIFGNFSYLNHN